MLFSAKLGFCFASCLSSSTPRAALRASMPAAAAAAAGRGAEPSHAGWNAELGVWENQSAKGLDVEHLPTPLYLFGYGSLIWKPPPELSETVGVSGYIRGFHRLFFQSSTDHRGTPEAPGLVATLVPTADLDKIGHSSSRDDSSRLAAIGVSRDEDLCHGVAYLIDDAHREEVLAGLDFREKGGYTQALVDFFPERERVGQPSSPEGASSSGGAGGGAYGERGAVSVSPVKALVYTATVCNPNFEKGLTLLDAAERVAAAEGPSGANWDYFVGLASYLRDKGLHDRHVAMLEEQCLRIRGQQGQQESHSKEGVASRAQVEGK